MEGLKGWDKAGTSQSKLFPRMVLNLDCGWPCFCHRYDAVTLTAIRLTCASSESVQAQSGSGENSVEGERTINTHYTRHSVLSVSKA